MNWLHLLMTGGTGMILGTAGGIGYYRIADPEKCRDWRILEVLVAAGLFLVGIALVVGSALGVLGFLIQRYGHPSEIATAGRWMSGLAVWGGGMGFAYYSLLRTQGEYSAEYDNLCWRKGLHVLAISSPSYGPGCRDYGRRGVARHVAVRHRGDGGVSVIGTSFQIRVIQIFGNVVIRRIRIYHKAYGRVGGGFVLQRV